MASVNQNGNQRQDYAEQHDGDLLDQVVANTVTQRQKQVKGELERKIERIADVLPKAMRKEAKRLTLIAQSTFNNNPDLLSCTPASFVKAVIEAASVGLAIDGKLAYAIKYSNKKKDRNGRDIWVAEASLHISYIGLVTVARRSGQILDCFADVFYSNDTFEHGRSGPKCKLEHTWDVNKPRGEFRGAYGIVEFPDGRWRYDIIDAPGLEDIRSCSKAKNAMAWTKFTNEMRKKSVTRRLLKMYCNDPDFLRACELDDREYDFSSPGRAEEEDVAPPENTSEAVPTSESLFEQYRSDIENERQMNSILDDIGFDEHQGKLTSAEADELRALLGKQAKQEAAS